MPKVFLEFVSLGERGEIEQSRDPIQQPCRPEPEGTAFPSPCHWAAHSSPFYGPSLISTQGLDDGKHPCTPCPVDLGRCFEVSEGEGITCHSEIHHKRIFPILWQAMACLYKSLVSSIKVSFQHTLQVTSVAGNFSGPAWPHGPIAAYKTILRGLY